MFTSLLIANSGEIACRAIKTAKRMRTIAVHFDADCIENDESWLH